jgi:hypothetical protein
MIYVKIVTICQTCTHLIYSWRLIPFFKGVGGLPLHKNRWVRQEKISWKFTFKPELICACSNENFVKDSKINNKNWIFLQQTWEYFLTASNILARNDMLGGLCKNNKIWFYLEHLDFFFTTMRFVFFVHTTTCTFSQRFLTCY